LEEEFTVKQPNVPLILATFIAILCLTSAAMAQAGDDRLALKGYDPVAYFTEKRPIVGAPQYRHEWDGAIYQFASAEHLALFRVKPDRYLPQYNNWCAASVAKGAKVHGNPEWWVVIDDRLYLFGKPIGPGLMKADPAAMKSQADENWTKVSLLPTPAVPDYMREASKPQ
jgi:YHS domain-containing protein